MKEHKKYTSVVRYGHPSTQNVLKKGDYITITEKIDGANASFYYDEETKSLLCSSRNLQLSEENTLNGFYNWVQFNITGSDIVPTYRYFGEWLTPHKIQYEPDKYQKFYLFSIWDELNKVYLSDEIVIEEAKRLGLETVPVFYRGGFKDYAHLQSFVGKSELAINKGEGIVVKNVEYKDKYGNQMFVKLVTEEFTEIQKQKKPKDPNAETNIQAFVHTVITPQRVEKILNKKLDEGLLNGSDLCVENMGLILKLTMNDIINDAWEEENALLKETYAKLGRKVVPSLIKEILKTNNAQS